MQSKAPLLSILIPTYNRKNELARAIESILGQSVLKNEVLDKIEIIVQNNASTDETYCFLEEIKFTHPCLKIFHNDTNIQLYGNIYEIIKRASGKYVLYLTDDDYLVPQSLQKILTILSSTNYDFIRLNLMIYFEKSIKSFTHRQLKNVVDNKTATLEETVQILTSLHILSGNIFRREKIPIELVEEAKNDDNQKWFNYLVIPLTMMDNFLFFPEALIVHTWENEVYWEDNSSNSSKANYSPIDNCLFYIFANSGLEPFLLKKVFLELKPNPALYPYVKTFFKETDYKKAKIKDTLFNLAKQIKVKIC